MYMVFCPQDLHRNSLHFPTSLHFTTKYYYSQKDKRAKLGTYEQSCAVPDIGGALDGKVLPYCVIWGFRRFEVEVSDLTGCYGEWQVTDCRRFERTYGLHLQRFDRNDRRESVTLLLGVTNEKCCIHKFYNFLRIQRFVNCTTVRSSKFSCQQKGVPFGF